jgi:hypothetical protein
MGETTPSNDIRTVTNRRPGDREHLTPDEVVELISAARKGRWGIRDAALLTQCMSTGSGRVRRYDYAGMRTI